MNLRRSKPAAVAVSSSATCTEPGDVSLTSDSFKEFVDRRDYTGALTLLTADELSPADDAPGKTDERDLWIAYCAFHLADYQRALQIYERRAAAASSKNDLKLHVACCYFMLGQYDQAFHAASQSAKCALRNRLMLHAAYKLGDQTAKVRCMKALDSSIADQLSLAALKFIERDYHDAINVYKQIVIKNRDYMALNVYIAQCYFKLNYYDMSQELASIYLHHHPDSVTAVNVQACNLYRLNGQHAAARKYKEMEELSSPSLEYGRDLRQHNMVVFGEDDKALQVLTPLIGVIPEALLNAVIFHLRQENAIDANKLLQLTSEPASSYECVLLAITYTLISQRAEMPEYAQRAIKLFQVVGDSPDAGESMLGYYCQVSSYFLLQDYASALKYLDLVKGYHVNGDEFNYNYGQAKAALGQYDDAIETLLMVRSAKYKTELSYCCSLAKSYIMTNKPELAYDVYRSMDLCAESVMLLDFIANHCYKLGQFSVSMKSFAALERFVSSPEVTHGKHAACVGVFQQVVAGKLPKNELLEVVTLLQASDPAPQHMLSVITRWAKENRVTAEQNLQQQQQQLVMMMPHDEDDNNNVTHM